MEKTISKDKHIIYRHGEIELRITLRDGKFHHAYLSHIDAGTVGLRLGSTGEILDVSSIVRQLILDYPDGIDNGD